VAVPVPLRRTFTYLWPAAADPPLAGARVRVPFRGRHLTGFVIETEGAEEPRDGLRPVDLVLDGGTPALTPALLELARFISSHYLAPLGQVLKSMIPDPGPGVRGAGGRPSRRVARARPGAQPEALAARARAQREALVVILERGGAASVEDLAAAGIRPAALAALAARGMIAWESEPRPAADLTGLDPGEGEIRAVTPDQAAAIEAIAASLRAREPGRFLLHGVTGSGKTEVYLQAARLALAQGRGVIILVPEIGLTPALIGRLAARFGSRLAALHSGLTAGERRIHWHRVAMGEADIVVGARSAIFAPLRDVGLIVVDEEHDSSYKQDESPRYQARDLALVRGRLERCPVVLASATPAMESRAQVDHGRVVRLALPRRIGGRSLPPFEIVDLRREFRETGRAALLSGRLIEALETTRASGGQAMLLLNRRGWASFLLCRACGEAIPCAHCSVSLTVHRQRGRLLCHYCGFARPLPEVCPACSKDALQEMGSGTERIEDELASLLPGLRALRMDADTVRARGGHARILTRFAAGEADVLLGTQMIAKGHDFPGVTLVGILAGDAVLGLPDFRAAEWTFQLATQVAGRAGRGRDPGRVILQAFRAEHYALACAREHDYERFYALEDRFRKALLYPPHAHLAALRVEHRDAAAGGRWIEALARHLRRDPEAGDYLRVLGPAPAPLARLRDRHRFHLLLKAKSRRRLASVLHRLAKHLEDEGSPGGRAVIDVDPSTIL
jgi:primosomal protein N' (replication factor Y)